MMELSAYQQDMLKYAKADRDSWARIIADRVANGEPIVSHTVDMYRAACDKVKDREAGL